MSANKITGDAIKGAVTGNGGAARDLLKPVFGGSADKGPEEKKTDESNKVSPPSPVQSSGGSEGKRAARKGNLSVNPEAAARLGYSDKRERYVDTHVLRGYYLEPEVLSQMEDICKALNKNKSEYVNDAIKAFNRFLLTGQFDANE